MDANTGEPLSFAFVRNARSNRSAQADEGGNWDLPDTMNGDPLRFAHPDLGTGYREVPANDAGGLMLVSFRGGTTLDPVVVERERRVNWLPWLILFAFVAVASQAKRRPF